MISLALNGMAAKGMRLQENDFKPGATARKRRDLAFTWTSSALSTEMTRSALNFVVHQIFMKPGFLVPQAIVLSLP
jgi:hypothetical protein